MKLLLNPQEDTEACDLCNEGEHELGGKQYPAWSILMKEEC